MRVRPHLLPLAATVTVAAMLSSCAAAADTGQLQTELTTQAEIDQELRMRIVALEDLLREQQADDDPAAAKAVQDRLRDVNDAIDDLDAQLTAFAADLQTETDGRAEGDAGLETLIRSLQSSLNTVRSSVSGLDTEVLKLREDLRILTKRFVDHVAAANG